MLQQIGQSEIEEIMEEILKGKPTPAEEVPADHVQLVQDIIQGMEALPDQESKDFAFQSLVEMGSVEKSYRGGITEPDALTAFIEEELSYLFPPTAEPPEFEAIWRSKMPTVEPWMSPELSEEETQGLVEGATERAVEFAEEFKEKAARGLEVEEAATLYNEWLAQTGVYTPVTTARERAIRDTTRGIWQEVLGRPEYADVAKRLSQEAETYAGRPRELEKELLRPRRIEHPREDPTRLGVANGEAAYASARRSRNYETVERAFEGHIADMWGKQLHAVLAYQLLLDFPVLCGTTMF